MNTIRKIGLAIFDDNKIMMAKTTKGHIRFVGGKVDGNETDIECLQREVKEEINATLDMESIQLLNTFKTLAQGQDDTYVEMPLYTGTLLDTPKPSSEVVEILFVDSTLDSQYRSPLTDEVFTWLKENSYIK